MEVPPTLGAKLGAARLARAMLRALTRKHGIDEASWDEVVAPEAVYRFAGLEPGTDPRRTEEYRAAVLDDAFLRRHHGIDVDKLASRAKSTAREQRKRCVSAGRRRECQTGKGRGRTGAVSTRARAKARGGVIACG